MVAQPTHQAVHYKGAMLLPPGLSTPSQGQTVHPLWDGAWLVGIPNLASPALRYHPVILDEVLQGGQTSLHQNSVGIQAEFIVKVVQWLIHSRHSSRRSDSLENNLHTTHPFSLSNLQFSQEYL